jgi:hypothetical protein
MTLKTTPLSLDKDTLIERWLRPIAPEKQNGKQGRIRLPDDLGKPRGVKRGRQNLSAYLAQTPNRRRVVVVAYYYRMWKDGYAKLHSHLRYIERPGAGEEAVTPRLFDKDRDEVNGHAEITGWRDDRHHWRIIVAPNDGAKLDMVEYTRAFMAEVEKELGTKLNWVASAHEKADAGHAVNRHAHIVVRGIADDGSDLLINREFLKHEFRRIAERLASDRLGGMGPAELERFEERQAERERNGQRNYNSGWRRADGSPPKATEMEREID